MLHCYIAYVGNYTIPYSEAIAFTFAVNLIENESHCFAISPAMATGTSQKIDASFVTDFPDHFRMTDFSVMFKFPSYNLQYGGSCTDCSAISRLGYWPSTYSTSVVSRTACNILKYEGLGLWNLSAGFTEVCIYRASQTDYGSPFQKGATYYAGELVISGFSTSTTLSPKSIGSPPCSISFDTRMNGTKNGSKHSTILSFIF